MPACIRAGGATELRSRYCKQAIHDKAEGKVTAFTLEMLRDTDRARSFVRGLKLSERERDIARDIIGTHALKVMSQSSLRPPQA